MDDVTRLLSDLVAIPSVNPMGRPLGGSERFEADLTDYLETYFRTLGVATLRQPIAPGRANLIARYDPPGQPRTTLLFDVHQDTVPTDGMVIDPFRPQVEGNRLYGRGACDIKGGMAAVLLAFARLVRERPAGSAAVVLACTVDEEFTHQGSTALALDPQGADLAVVVEPTLLDLVDRHKGATRWKVRTRGVACHSSTPERGENAIYRMARVIAALAEHAAELAQGRPDPVLGPPSLSVGRIEGGQSVNVVPDWCEIEVDRRIIPGEVGSDCRGAVEGFLRRRLGAEADQVEFRPAWVDMPPLVPGAVGPACLEAIREAVQTVTGRRPGLVGVPYGTDAGPLSAGGLPSVVFGPGDIAQAHTRDEWVDLDQIRAGVDCYYAIARALGAVAPPPPLRAPA